MVSSKFLDDTILNSTNLKKDGFYYNSNVGTTFLLKEFKFCLLIFTYINPVSNTWKLSWV